MVQAKGVFAPVCIRMVGLCCLQSHGALAKGTAAVGVPLGGSI